MANNRTEFKSEVDNNISSIVTIAKHKTTLQDDLADSINFRKDVKSATIVATLSTNSIDFTSNDLVTIDGATNNLDLDLSVINTQDGEDSKYIRVIKDAGKSVSFLNAVDITTFSGAIDELTAVTYEVFNKNGSIFVRALVDNISSNVLLVKEIEIGSWDMDATNSVLVAHGLTFSKIKYAVAVIFNDGQSQRDSLMGEQQISAGSVNVLLTRLPSGPFDSTLYNDTGINRGFIYVYYEL
jgi:hypothetical protein